MPAQPPGPIEAATADLLSFVEQAGGGPVRVGVPVDGDDAQLWLWPYELRAGRQTTGTGPRNPYRFVVRYLLVGSGAGALGLLDRVLAAAVRAGEPELVLEPPDSTVWRTLGLAPRPVLGFHVPATVTFPTVDAPVVLGPLVLRQLELRPLSGVVVGPGDQPVAGVRVEVSGTRLSTYTGRAGEFGFAGVPTDARLELRVVGRGRTFTATVEPTDTDPVTVHCDFTGTAATT